MIRFVLLFTLLSLNALTTEMREVYYQGDLAPLNIGPTFDKGYLIVYKTHAGVTIYSPDGSMLYDATAYVPDASHIGLENAAVDTDGSMVAAIRYRKDKVYFGGIAMFDSAGRQTQLFDTRQYLPTQVCIGPDHSIWTMGYKRPRTAASPTDDYSTVRNYSRDGQELGAFLPRSSFAGDLDPVGPVIGGWQLRIANGKVGGIFYASSILRPGQQNPSTLQWIELDLKGNVLGRWEVSPKRVAAFAENGSVYAQDQNGISVLDRSSGSWRPVAGMQGELLGAEGDSLVFKVRGENTLRRVSLPR